MQIKKPKTSSRAKTLLAEYKKLRNPKDRVRFMLSIQDRKTALQVLELSNYQERRKLLVNLANLHDEGHGRFWRIFRGWFPRMPNKALLALRNELRTIWTPSVASNDKDEILQRWFIVLPPGTGAGKVFEWKISFWTGKIEPDPRNIRGVLLFGVLDNVGKLAICQNPECVCPYFFTNRKDQKVCELGECTKYAQRKFALEHYHRKGKKQRMARNAKKPGKRRRK